MSSAYCSSDFELEFGKIIPSFLPLGNKRLYEHQVNLFKEITDRIILTIPQSFNVSKSDLEKINTLDIELLKVPDELNLGEALVYTINMYSPLKEILYVFYGDAYFNYLEFNENSLTLSKVKENYNWAYFFDKNKANYDTRNKIEPDAKLVLSGFISIKDPYFLVKCILKNRYLFIEGLREYSKEYLFEIYINQTWRDFGLITSYFYSRKAISTQRSFNNLRFCENGYIVKASSWSNKIKAEINWYENFPKELDVHIPKFQTNNENSYKIEYLYNNTLSELFVFGSLPYYVWENIFISLDSFLNRLHDYKNVAKKNLVFDYEKKTLERLKLLQCQNNDLWQWDDLINREYYFNNREPISLQNILNEINMYLVNRNSEYCIIHGDFCFSNIMFDFRSGMIKAFDPRGMDFEEEITIYGDKDYDYAKLTHCIFGMYDFIISGYYTCKIDGNRIYLDFCISDEIFKIQDKFLDIFKLNKKIFAITIHLFLSMLPLHNDSKSRQKALFSNIFRLYFLFKDRGLI